MSEELYFKNAPRAEDGAPCVRPGTSSNPGLFCRMDRRNCKSCGFNPTVAERRLRQIRKRQVDPEEKPRRVKPPTWATDYADVKARCPFYLGIDRNNKYILCNGLRKKSNLMMHFTRKEDFEAYTKAHCKGHYSDCRLYQIMNGK